MEKKELSSLKDLSTAITQETALFVFFKLASKEDIGFCYVSPPTCKIKDRMLFAASRQTVISQVEALLSVSIKKKVSIFFVETQDKLLIYSVTLFSTRQTISTKFLMRITRMRNPLWQVLNQSLDLLPISCLPSLSVQGNR